VIVGKPTKKKQTKTKNKKTTNGHPDELMETVD